MRSDDMNFENLLNPLRHLLTNSVLFIYKDHFLDELAVQIPTSSIKREVCCNSDVKVHLLQSCNSWKYERNPECSTVTITNFTQEFSQHKVYEILKHCQFEIGDTERGSNNSTITIEYLLN